LYLRPIIEQRGDGATVNMAVPAASGIYRFLSWGFDSSVAKSGDGSRRLPINRMIQEFT